MDIIKAKEDIKTKIVSLSSKSKEEIQKELKDMPESERKAIEAALSNPKEFFKGCDDVNGLQKEIKAALDLPCATLPDVGVTVSHEAEMFEIDHEIVPELPVLVILNTSSEDVLSNSNALVDREIPEIAPILDNAISQEILPPA